jgi:putative flippase GtrA
MSAIPDPHRLLRRWLAFSLVGVLGFAVQLTTLVVLAGGLGVHYLVATALAVELAILHNFLWHRRWTWSDRATMHIVGRLLKFNAGTALTSIGGNLLLMWLLVSLAGLHYALANVITVLSLGIINFLFCDRLVFPLARVPAVRPSLAADGGKR